MKQMKIRAHKIKLRPNNKQVTYFKKACGVARFAYNWGLAYYKEQRDADPDYKFRETEIRKALNAVKHEMFPWMNEVTKCAPQLAIKVNLNNAFRGFFNKTSDYPKFHKKGVHESFAISNDQFQLRDNYVRIPKLGWVKMCESLRFDGKVLGATISERAGYWFIAIQVEIAKPIREMRNNAVIGLDLGVKHLVTLSNGEKFVGPKALIKYGQKLRRLNQALARSIGSKRGEIKSQNFRKKQAKIQKLYYKIFNVRNDSTHKLTTMLVKTYTVIGIEDLQVERMLSDSKFAKHIADQSFYEFRRQLTYKSEHYSSSVIIVDKYYPSSKLCSACGNLKETLAINERTYHCSCGVALDRDVNAAVNLRNYALNLV